MALPIARIDRCNAAHCLWRHHVCRTGADKRCFNAYGCREQSDPGTYSGSTHADTYSSAETRTRFRADGDDHQWQ